MKTKIDDYDIRLAEFLRTHQSVEVPKPEPESKPVQRTVKAADIRNIIKPILRIKCTGDKMEVFLGRKLVKKEYFHSPEERQMVEKYARWFLVNKVKKYYGKNPPVKLTLNDVLTAFVDKPVPQKTEPATLTLEG